MNTARFLPVTPEARLLLRLSRRAPAREELLSLAQHVDWDRFLELAQDQNAAAIVWPVIADVAPARLRGTTAQRFQQVAQVAEFRLQYLEERLAVSLDVLSRAGIETVLLKGAAVAYTAYPSFSARPMADIDLLVRPEHAEAARVQLLGAGWEWNREPGLDEFYKGHQHLPPLDDRGRTGLSLELHTALFFHGNPFRFTPDDVWRESVEVQVRGGATARVPAARHQFLHACVHYAWSHSLHAGAWRTFRDLDALMNGPLGADGAFAAAQERTVRSCCYWTLRLARDLGGLDVPDRMLDQLRPRLPEWVLAILERHFAVHALPTDRACPSVSVDRRMWRAAIQPWRSAHGDIRPWDRHRLHAQGRFPAGVTAAPRRDVMSVNRWRRYLGAILLPSRGVALAEHRGARPPGPTQRPGPGTT